MAFGEKTVRAEVDGHLIEAVNTWFQGASIRVDGAQVAHSNAKLALDEVQPLLSATVEGDAGPMRIEMHVLSILFTQIELRVNGRHVAGERLIKEDEA